MQNVVNALLNMILVSLPEETFVVMMTLIFLKRFDLLDIRMWRQNLKWVMIPVLPSILIINLRYVTTISKPILSLTCLIVINVLTVYIVLKSNYEKQLKLVVKTILFTFLGIFMIEIFEVVYIPISLLLLHKPIEFFNNNIFYNFLLALPSRIIEICIILFIIIRKNNAIQMNLFNTIVKNKFFTTSFLTIITFLVLTIIYIAKLITVDNILINLGVLDQLIITIIITSTPTILITWFLMFINYLLTKEKQIQQTYENLIIQDDVTADVENQI